MYKNNSLSKILYLGLSLLLLFAIQPVQAVSPGVEPSAPSVVINVTTTTDKLAVTCSTVKPGDLSNPISLREAICATNNTTVHDTINLPKGVYTLDLGAKGDDDNEYGDLDIKYDLTIVGAKGAPEPDGTVIENGYGSNAVKGDGDRIIHVIQSPASPDLKLEKVALRYADVSCSYPCDDDAAAVLFESSGKLTVLDSLIYKNYSACTGDECHGGVLAVHLTEDSSELLIQGSTIKLNTSECQSKECRAGELIKSSGNSSEATINDSTIEQNTISCKAEDCKASELFELDELSKVTVESTKVMSNTLTCEGDSCEAAEIFDVNDTNVVDFKNSQINYNEIMADGDVLDSSEKKQASAEEIIDANLVTFLTLIGLDIKNNSIECEGTECVVEEVLRTSDGDTRTLMDVTIDGNTQECSGDGDGDTSGDDYERACKVDQVLDLDEVTDVDVEDTTIQNNTQKCTGNALDSSEPGCIVDEVINSEGSNNDIQIYKNLRVINNHIDCVGARCDVAELLYIDQAEVDFYHLTFHGNSLKCKGPGCKHDDLIQFASESDVAIHYSTFSGNLGLCEATNCDQQIFGGINNKGMLNIYNSTISGNQVNGSGAALLNRDGTEVNLNNVTIFGNKADADGNGVGEGGGICNDDAMADPNLPSDSAYVGICTGDLVDQNDPAEIDMSNTILAGNLDPTSNPDCYGTIESKGFNLIQNVSAGCIVNGDITGNIEGKDPLLFPLADNGGVTWTHALSINSPAVDAGENITCEPDDQREFLRTFGSKCDIGAYERGPFIYQPIVFRE